jgi:hypothetical protein
MQGKFKKRQESRMLGNLHVRFGVGVKVELLGLHHLNSLRRRDRRIAETLALGNRTTDVAKRFKVCAGRVSQIRRELAESWRVFVGEEPKARTAGLATA